MAQKRKRTRTNRKYKDTVFRMLFGKDRKELLGLYNAVNGTDYTDETELEINTLEGAIFAGVKNDVSFLFQDSVSLYEHQSTMNPNLPLRDLFYVSDLLQEMTVDLNLYSSTILKIPNPHFVVFYNGVGDLNGIAEYRLSELFRIRDEEPQLELKVRIININQGQDNEVMKGCKTLRDYAAFIGMVRDYQKTMPIDEALPKAVDECIRRGILKEFLKKHKAQVIKMSIYEFDAQKLRESDRAEGRAEGREEGREEGIAVFIQDKLEDQADQYLERYGEVAQTASAALS